MDNWKLTIEIDGESAKELFAVGPIDIKDWLLTKTLGIKQEDIVSVGFRTSIINNSERAYHADNYRRIKD